MKNKRNTYILLSAVLILWGIIGYRVFASFKPPKENNNGLLKTEKFHSKEITAKETYIIQANYRDPFLGTIKKRKKKTSVVPKSKKEKIIFPNVEYKGVFSSNVKKNTVYLIKINNKKEMFKIKEVHQDVRLLQGDTENITLKYKTKKQIFYLNK